MKETSQGGLELESERIDSPSSITTEAESLLLGVSSNLFSISWSSRVFLLVAWKVARPSIHNLEL